MAFAAIAASRPPFPLPPPRHCQGNGSGNGDAVYVAAVPLRAAKGPAQLALTASYSLGLWDLQHFMVAIETEESSVSPSEIFVFDFQPRDPENFFVTLAALSLRKVPGIVLKRNLSRLPKSRCWFVGFAQSHSTDVADKFTENWHEYLILGRRDCRHYTNELVECLTGQKLILDQLRSTFHG